VALAVEFDQGARDAVAISAGPGGGQQMRCGFAKRSE
jgi:hypothetical protein